MHALPDLDQNTGNNIGRAEVCEGRREGKRQWSASAYSLEGVDILTDTLAKRVVLKRDGTTETPKATGVEVVDGTVYSGKNIIVSAGAFKTPQLLMLSGVGPSAHLKDVGIEPLVDLPEVGQGLHDHMSLFQHWRLRESNAGYVLGSANPLFQQPEFALGVPLDWLACADVDKKGLAEAIQKDVGSASDAAKHPLVTTPRAMLEMFVMHMKLPFPGIAMDADHVTSDVATFLPTSRGTITLRSADAKDPPKSELAH